MWGVLDQHALPLATWTKNTCHARREMPGGRALMHVLALMAGLGQVSELTRSNNCLTETRNNGVVYMPPANPLAAS